MDHLFRTAAFGGFQRQDVLTYLEQTAKEQQEKQQQLQQQLSQAQETGERQSKQLSEQGERLNALAGENQQLRAQLEELRQSLSASQAQAERAGEELARVRGELEAARNRVAALEPDAAAYAAVKERTAGVELEAHRRAQGVLDQANSQARHLRQQMEQWMTRVGREYDALRTEVEATISHAADQLDKAGKCLEQVSALLSDQDVALEELSRAYDSTAPDKVPAPVPLEEEP